MMNKSNGSGIGWKAGFIALIGMVPLLAFGQKVSFYDEVVSLTEANATKFESISKIAGEGEVAKANGMLAKLADESKDPAMIFIVANMLYGADPAKSYQLHKKVYEALPDEKLVNLEWAMERHRKGEYPEAATLYGKYLELEPLDVKCNALLADCLLRSGKMKEAVEKWNAAKHGQNHVSIDFAIFEIYGGPLPLQRWGDLSAKINAGKTELIEQLLWLDMNWDQNWWNKSVNQHRLSTDSKMAEKILGSENQRLLDAKCYIKLKTGDLDTASIKAAMLKAGVIIGDKGRLPANSKIASGLIEIALENNFESRTQIIDRFGNLLLERAKSKEGDSEALNILCYLSIKNDREKLAEYDRYGWERYHEARFAGSLLAGMIRTKELKLSSPELKQALADFPENGVIAMIQLELAGDKDVTNDIIATAIKSQYRRLDTDSLVPGNSYAIKSLFHKLETHLK